MGKIKPGHFLEYEDVIRLLRSEIERAGGQMPWAKMVGVDRSHVNKILQGAKPLGISIVKALSIRVVFAPNPEIDRCGAQPPAIQGHQKRGARINAIRSVKSRRDA
jgi:hypothetical protein